MEPEDHKRIAHLFYERVIGKADFSQASQVVGEDFLDHGNPHGLPRGVEGLKQFLAMLTTAFPDISIEVNEMIAEKDLVAVRLTISGTQKGVLLGTIPASGKRAAWNGMDFLRFAGGKIVERWSVRDLLGLMRQIDAIKN